MNGSALYSDAVVALGPDLIMEVRLPDSYIFDADAAYSGILLKFTDLERGGEASALTSRQSPFPYGGLSSTSRQGSAHLVPRPPHAQGASRYAPDTDVRSRWASAATLHGERDGTRGVAQRVAMWITSCACALASSCTTA